MDSRFYVAGVDSFEVLTVEQVNAESDIDDVGNLAEDYPDVIYFEVHPPATELEVAVAKARECAEGDSNDAEIEALQDALDIALGELGREDLRS
jgi:hypothetical protein